MGFDCGSFVNACGVEIDCGGCRPGEVCGGAGEQNVCSQGCDCCPATCEQEGVSCGLAGDGCGSVLDCGECTAPETCGGGGFPGECG
jgi:hypothetical protein